MALRIASSSDAIRVVWASPLELGLLFGAIDPTAYNEYVKTHKGKPLSHALETLVTDETLRERLVDAVVEATWVLNVLTAGVIHGQECWIEDYRLSGCEVHLRRTPVLDVLGVWVVKGCGREQPVELKYDEYCVRDWNTVSVCCVNGIRSGRCGCSDTVLRVHYMIGSTLPPGTEAKVLWLAQEYLKAATGQKCALPERVTNISRQGVSWTLIDPQDFLDKGLTGTRLDSWLNTVKRATGNGAALIDPLKSMRVSSVGGPCGGEFGDGDVSDAVPDPFASAFNVDVD